MGTSLVVSDSPDDQDDDCYQEHQYRNAVHAVHQKDVDIAGLIRVSFLQKEVLLDLIPDAAFILLIRLAVHS